MTETELSGETNHETDAERPKHNSGHEHGHERPFAVMVRTPAGFAHEFPVKPSTKVHRLLKEAVAYFVGQGQLQPGNYRLVDVTEGASRTLTDSSRLGESGVTDSSMLSLKATDPQVDG